MRKSFIIIIILLPLIYSFIGGYNSIKNKYFSVETSISKGLTIITIDSKHMNFSTDTKKSEKYDFYLNANFFKSDGTIEGFAKVNGKVINTQSRFGGSFYTINNKPFISMYGCVPSSSNCVQTAYRGIINGKINTNVTNTKINSKKLYRTIIGKNKKGDLVIIHSTRWGFISMYDICQFALKLGITDGLLFDGGSSIDLKIGNSDDSHTYQSVPTIFKRIFGIKTPPIYIVGKFI
jgi:hypothetical protein